MAAAAPGREPDREWGNGDGGLMTTGAENRFGNRGANYYYNGTGTLPANGTQLVVTGVPGVPGETHTITFSAQGVLASAGGESPDSPTGTRRTDRSTGSTSSARGS